MGGEGLGFRRLRNRNVTNVRGAGPVVQKLGGHESDYGFGGFGGFGGVALPPPLPNFESKVSDATFVGTDRSLEVGRNNDGEAGDDEELEYLGDFGDEIVVPTGFVKPKFRLDGDSTKPATLWSVGYKSEELPNHVELGTIATPVGRCLVFKNSLQHKVKL